MRVGALPLIGREGLTPIFVQKVKKQEKNLKNNATYYFPKHYHQNCILLVTCAVWMFPYHGHGMLAPGRIANTGKCMATKGSLVLDVPFQRKDGMLFAGAQDTVAKCLAESFSGSPVAFSSTEPFRVGQPVLFALLVHNTAVEPQTPEKLSLSIDGVAMSWTERILIDQGRIEAFRFSLVFSLPGTYLVYGCADMSTGPSRILVVEQ